MLKVCRQSPEIHLKPSARHNKSQELSSTNPWHTSKYEFSLRALTEESGWLAAGKAHGPLLQHPLVSEPLRDWSWDAGCLDAGCAGTMLKVRSPPPLPLWMMCHSRALCTARAMPAALSPTDHDSHGQPPSQLCGIDLLPTHTAAGMGQWRAWWVLVEGQLQVVAGGVGHKLQGDRKSVV